MAVSVNPYNAPQKKEKESDLDRVLKGLQVAGSVYGIYADTQKIEAAREASKMQAEKAGQERTIFQQGQEDRANKQAGIVNPIQAAELQKDFDVSKTPNPSAQTLYKSVAGGQAGPPEPLYIMPKKKEVAPRDPLTVAIANENLKRLQLGNQEEVAEKQAPGFVPAPGFSPTKEDAKLIKELNSAKNQANITMGKIRDLIEEHGSEAWGSYSDQMDDLVASAKLQIKDVNRLGQLTGGDFQLIDAKVVDPTTLSSAFKSRGRMMSQIDSLMKNSNDAVNEAAKARGFMPAGAQEKDTQQTKTTQKNNEFVGSLLPKDLQAKSKEEQLKHIDSLIMEKQKKAIKETGPFNGLKPKGKS